MTFITIVTGFALGVAITYVVGVVMLIFFYNNYFKASE